MAQEWDIDYLPSDRARSRIRWEKIVEHDAPRRKSAWRWFVSEMRGPGPLLYKATVALLAFTVWSACVGFIASGSVVLTLLVLQAL